MAAYAALVSVMHIIDQIQRHPRPPISLDKTQVESLAAKITFLQEFLEGYSHVGYSKEPDALESRIADAAYAAEDVIESHIVDQIMAGSTSHGEKISSIDFYQDLQKVIEDLDSIKKEVVQIKDDVGVQHQLLRNSRSVGSLRSFSAKQDTMVGFDDVSLEIIDKLIGGQLDRQIISIVGMGGIGKTTLARNIYRNRLVLQHFDILAWVTITQEYRMKDILSELLQEGGGNLSQTNEHELGDRLHKKLSGRRYLIIMDDIWDVEVWEQLQFFFPDNSNGSRIMLTTRLSNLATQVADTRGRVDMAFLDEDNSWSLFSKIVFGEEGCPLDWERIIGKKIVKNCKGLPLSIVVIGGFLAKSEPTREFWEYIEKNLNSIVNSEDNEHCFKILRMSYSHLPVYLKPCFLYMGVFKEDRVIYVSMLIKLWVAEGFLRPISGKSLEEIAKEYLKELVNRNLVLVERLGCTGSIKRCIIHDLVRDLCLKEAQGERFYNITRQHILDIPQRRIVIPKSTSKEKVLVALQSVPLARSLISDIEEVLPPLNFRLMRILKTFDERFSSNGSYFLENMFQLVNSRYIAIRAPLDSKFPSSINRLWNLHTLIVTTSPNEGNFIAPSEIWNMPQLRHVKFPEGLYLPDPPSGNIGGQDDTIVLENLQMLSKITNFKCDEEVVKRIPNIKKLIIWYEEYEEGSSYCLNNLVHLHKLESFGCYSSPASMPSGTNFLQNLTFPHSLKKLAIGGNHVHWEDMLEKIVSLPLLEKLTLMSGFFVDGTWETVEGQFHRLKFLQIYYCCNLEYWVTESSHFPCLERLELRYLEELKEIPMDIGEIPTLQSIKLVECSKSVAISAKQILEEQEELLGEAGLQVRVIPLLLDSELERLASPNFQVDSWYDQ